MPDMGGIEAVREICKTDPDAKILMCSAMGQQALVVEAIQAGAKDFVVKPFQPSRVLEAVQRVLADPWTCPSTPRCFSPRAASTSTACNQLLLEWEREPAAPSRWTGSSGRSTRSRAWPRRWATPAVAELAHRIGEPARRAPRRARAGRRRQSSSCSSGRSTRWSGRSKRRPPAREAAPTRATCRRRSRRAAAAARASQARRPAADEAGRAAPRRRGAPLPMPARGRGRSRRCR